MKPDIVDALVTLKPGAIWTLPNNPTATNDYERLVWQDESQTKPTEDEVNSKVTELVNAYPMKLLRDERDRLILQTDWRIVVAKETGTNIPAAWKTYRKALRDLPASSTPKLDSNDNLDMNSVTWPTPPS
jgi:hypothetical protein